MLNVLLVTACAYLSGSIPFGYLITRCFGVDIRNVGSGNIGATNVARSLGKKLGLTVFIFDVFKGAIPAGFAYHWMGIEAGIIAAIGSLLGHMFPVWLGFRGGKGVATGAGALAVLLPIPVTCGLLTWLAIFSSWRMVSLASLGGAAVMAIVAAIPAVVEPNDALNKKALLAWGAFLLVALRHRSNICRLLEGNESRFAESSTLHSVAKIIHVLALALWFGANVFFSLVAAVLIFRTWEGYAQDPPAWLPGFTSYTKETGTRIAGATVGPIFPFFFALQGMCALLALLTSVAFTRWEPHCRVHRLRFALVALAAFTVAIGWPISIRVSELREQRYSTDMVVASTARSHFGPWHTVSLFLNFGTIGLTCGATALTAFLPPQEKQSASG